MASAPGLSPNVMHQFNQFFMGQPHAVLIEQPLRQMREVLKSGQLASPFCQRASHTVPTAQHEAVCGIDVPSAGPAAEPPARNPHFSIEVPQRDPQPAAALHGPLATVGMGHALASRPFAQGLLVDQAAHLPTAGMGSSSRSAGVPAISRCTVCTS